jgi:hypothetical protein
VHDDSVTAARRAPELHALLPELRSLAELGQERWPTDTLDVPADPAGRAHYQRLRDAQQALRDVAYRRRLAEVDPAPRHDALAARAFRDATESLTRARCELGPTRREVE